MGCMVTIGTYLGIKESNKLQQISKFFYNKMAHQIVIKIELPCTNLVLESNRKEISIGFWRENVRDCQSKKVLTIGEGEGETSPSVLGFQEIYFQYFVAIDYRTFAAFPLEQEAILKKGFLVTFDTHWKFKSSTPLPDLADNTMRPTAVLLNAPAHIGRSLLMLGGRQDRCSQIYIFSKQKWMLTPKLPVGHNITTSISVNWKEKAIFTFVIDAQMTIKSAVLDLEKATYTELETENTQEMYWALNWHATEHEMNRLHVKAGITLEDGTIAVFARGRTKGMVQ